MSVGYRTMSMAEMSTILRNLQRSLESLQSQVNSLSGGGGGIGGGATSHNLLSTTHSDTEADTVVQGDLIVGGATPTWERLALGASGTFLKSDGSNPSWLVLQASDIDTLALLLDQTTPQTVINGIPLLDQEYDDFSNLKEFVNKGYVDWAVTAIGAAYYMTDDTDGDTGYKICSLTPSAGSETYIEASGVADGQLLGTWISDVGEEPAKLLRGIYDWFIFAEKVSGTKTLRLYWELYERKTDTSEVLIATSSESNELDTGVKTSHIVPLVLDSDYTPDAGSRIVGKFYAAVSGSGNAPTVRLYYQGISGSRWEIPTSTEVLNNIYIKRDEIGIDDDEILQVDQASGLTAGNLVRATSSGLESRTDAEILTQLSGKASAAFDWNGQDLDNIRSINVDYSANISNIDFFSTRTIRLNFESYDGWTSAVSGSGSVFERLAFMQLSTGTTSGSTAREYTGFILPSPWKGPSFYEWIVIPYTLLSDSEFYCIWQQGDNDVNNSKERFGFKVVDGLIYVLSGDETNEECSSTGVIMTQYVIYHLRVVVPDHNIFKFYVNGVLKATHTAITMNSFNFALIQKVCNTAASNKSFAIRGIYMAHYEF